MAVFRVQYRFSMPDAPDASTPTQPALPLGDAVRAWFRRPRAHGELLYNRRVTWLELFYDLVFVVLIAQITHRLAADISVAGVFEYAVMFFLVWLGWLNGSYYQELHGQNDGRSRLYIFGQMTFLVAMTIYAGHAVDDPGQALGFGIAYFLLTLLLAYQWWYLRRVDDPRFQNTVAAYVAFLLVTGTIVFAASFIPNNTIRTVVWGAAALVSVLAQLVTVLNGRSSGEGVTDVTESWAERMGLFIIVVLGEVVVGVGDGLAEGEPTVSHLFTGMLMLFLGFAIWWTYFDFIGRREPLHGERNRFVWITVHMVLAGAIAAVGAGMVSMIEHSDEAVVPLASRFLIAWSLAVMLLALAAIVSTMPRRPALRRTLPILLMGAVYSVLLALVPLAPMAFAVLLPLPLWVAWLLAFSDAARGGELIIEIDE